MPRGTTRHADLTGFGQEDLRVTVRIAADFYDFLAKSGDEPPAKEVGYMMDTIRSGMDGFFSLAYICRVINTRRDTWTFEPAGDPAF